MPSGVEVQVLSRAPVLILGPASGGHFYMLYLKHEQDNQLS